jgi:hypothetical protein
MDTPAPIPDALAKGVVFAVYANDGISHATARAIPVLTRMRPEAAMLHSGPDDLAAHAPTAAASIRAAVPGIGVWVAIGCDYKLRQQRLAGHYDGDAVVRHLATVGDTARRIGAAAIMLDPESELELLGKANPALAAYVVREALKEIRKRAPGIPIYFTSFDHPTVHQSMPWEALLGKDSPITANFPQVYAAAGTGVCSRGALEAREFSAMASWLVEVRKGLIRPDVEGPDTPDDLDCFPYLQLHGVPASDTIRVGCERRYVSLWAIGSGTTGEDLCDAEGEHAALAICELRRRGFVGPDAVARFERSAGLPADSLIADPHGHGIAGPMVLRALGVI